jgi:hypothetical protein
MCVCVCVCVCALTCLHSYSSELRSSASTSVWNPLGTVESLESLELSYTDREGQVSGPCGKVLKVPWNCRYCSPGSRATPVLLIAAPFQGQTRNCPMQVNG